MVKSEYGSSFLYYYLINHLVIEFVISFPKTLYVKLKRKKYSLLLDKYNKK